MKRLANIARDLMREGRLVHLLLLRVPAWAINGLTVTLGLALIHYTMDLVVGESAAQAALGAAACASLADVVTSTRRVARRVLAAIIASTLASTLFFVVRPHGGLIVPVVALTVFVAMMILSWGTKAGPVSFAATLALVFAMSAPDAETFSLTHLGWSLCGSIAYWSWTVMTAWVLQLRWRSLLLATAIDGMAVLLEAIASQATGSTSSDPHGSVIDKEVILAQRIQAARDLVFACGRGQRANLETSLLLQLIDLRDLAVESSFTLKDLGSVEGTQAILESVDRIITAEARVLRLVARAVREGTRYRVDAHRMESQIDRAQGDIRSVAFDRLLAGSELVRLLNNKLELVRTMFEGVVVGGAGLTLPCQRKGLKRYVAADDWQLSTVASNLRLSAPVFRHALRVSIAAGAAYAVLRSLPWTLHPQWVVLTVAAVMQGSLAQTIDRRDSRVLGTLMGCVVVAVLTATSNPGLFPAYLLIASGVAHAFFGVRYSVTAGAATVMAILQEQIVAPMSDLGIVERFGDTLLGALVGWGATYALPTWERERLTQLLQRANGALQVYAREAMMYRGDVLSHSPKFARQQAYDAIGALNEVRIRSRGEPRNVRVSDVNLAAWIAVAYALMSHLSSVRLALTLHVPDHGDTALSSAMAAVSRELDVALGANSSSEGAMSKPGVQDGLALKSIPDLFPRVLRVFGDVSRLEVKSVQLRHMV